MNMLIFHVCLYLWNIIAASAECLPKYGFGLSPIVTPLPVDGQYSLKSNMSACQTHCDDQVTLKLHLYSITAVTLIASFNYSMIVPSLYQKLIPVQCTNLQ